jgi:RNA recognition motif-containing protein
LRKVFIGGLSWNTTEGICDHLSLYKTDQLREYFEAMGHPVEKITIMRDKESGKSRGFGFIFFQRAESVHQIPSVCTIESRKVANWVVHSRWQVEVKPAISKEEIAKQPEKIFIGGIPVYLSDKKVRKHFEKYGTILEFQIIKDQTTRRSRGFGFVRYEDPAVIDKVMSEEHFFFGKQVRPLYSIFYLIGRIKESRAQKFTNGATFSC